jgi:OmcA/MtrC family decaheme c-type cytochrome
MRLHPGGDRPNDDRCTVCHESTEPALSPIIDSHFTKWQRPFAVDLEIVIHSATLTATRLVQVEFSVLVDGVGRDISTAPLTSLSATVAGPTTDYLFNAGFTLTSSGTLAPVDPAAGRFTWTSAVTVDTIAATALADPLRTAPGISASGTWAIGIQATLRLNGDVTSVACTGTTTTTCTAAAPAPMGGRWGCVAGFCTEQFDYVAENQVGYFAITDPVAVPRRQVVSIERCNGCHQQLALHGGGRNSPEYCAMCHNSTWDTADRMPVPTGTTVRTHSLSLANFIHRIHTGDDGVSDATFWGPRPASPINSGGTPVDFSDVRFPADRRMCVRCHTDESTAFNLEAMQGLRAPRTRLIDDTRTIIDTYTVGAITSACTGCHDSPASIAHAETMTSALGTEACTTCHAAGDTFGVDVVHERPEFLAP